MQFIERREKETSEIKLRESADRVKRGQCALTPLTSVKSRFNPHFDGDYLY